ncbi:MAG: hypothetical protein WA364_05630 [Candidatus Nitrosopolaris sp.]
MTNSVVMKLSQFFKYTFLLCSSKLRINSISMRLRLHDPQEKWLQKNPSYSKDKGGGYYLMELTEY